MGLKRIGKTAVDPETIARIDDVWVSAKKTDVNYVLVRVTFQDGSHQDYEDDPQMESFRKFVAALPDALSSPTSSPSK